MNGEPLPEEHGFPVRMVVPGLYGYVSATKWVVELEVTRFDRATAYWTDRGWGERGPIKIESRIDVRASGTATTLLGRGRRLASAHRHRAASRCRSTTARGTTAELADGDLDRHLGAVGYRGDAAAGEHTVRVRATGADGETQTEDVAGVLPDGATGYHTVDVSL